MLRSILLITTLLCSGIAFATSKSYQVDLIVFANQQPPAKTKAPLQKIPFIPDSKAILLSDGSQHTLQAFQLLKPSASGLKDEYYRLNHHASYKVLAHYSWRQPASNQKAVVLPRIQQKGWEIQGTVRVQRSNYYLFDTQLQYSPPDNPESSFFLTQKQRLKEGTVYYLDHPQIGIMLKIHQ